MKSKDFLKELGDLPDQELVERSRSLAEELMRLRFRKTSGQLEQSHELREIRRNLARVRTVLSRRSRDAGATVEG